MGRWKLVAAHGEPWQLYDMRGDRSETNNLSASRPDLRSRMIAMYDAWAERVGVQPWPVKRKSGFTPPNLPYPETADYE